MKGHRLVRQVLIWILALPLPSTVTINKAFNLSEYRFFFYKNEANMFLLYILFRGLNLSERSYFICPSNPLYLTGTSYIVTILFPIIVINNNNDKMAVFWDCSFGKCERVLMMANNQLWINFIPLEKYYLWDS